MFINRALTGSIAALAIAFSSMTAVADPAASLALLQQGVLSKGPNGEDPSPAADLSLNAAEIAKIKAMNATAAIVMHYGGNDWSRAQIEGLKFQFAEMGVEVVAVTDAGLNLKSRLLISKQLWHANLTSLCLSRPTQPQQQLRIRPPPPLV